MISNTLTKLELMTVEDWKIKFKNETKVSDIKYSYDSGWYSHIDNDFMNELDRLMEFNLEMYDEIFSDTIQEYLDNNSDTPSCDCECSRCVCPEYQHMI